MAFITDTLFNPFRDFVNLEMPRRSPTLTKTITSYDGDPNLGGAPAILQGSPLGTWFREETVGRWWRKSETQWEVQDSVIAGTFDGGSFFDTYVDTIDFDGGTF